MVLASCGDKYYRTNFISAVPTSLLIAPGLRTIQFLFSFFPPLPIGRGFLLLRYLQSCTLVETRMVTKGGCPRLASAASLFSFSSFYVWFLPSPPHRLRYFLHVSAFSRRHIRAAIINVNVPATHCRGSRYEMQS
jgi:hypothetical protein